MNVCVVWCDCLKNIYLIKLCYLVCYRLVANGYITTYSHLQSALELVSLLSSAFQYLCKSLTLLQHYHQARNSLVLKSFLIDKLKPTYSTQQRGRRLIKLLVNLLVLVNNNYQRTDLILISTAIAQTHVKSEIIRLRGRPLIISPDKPDQLQVILNELHLAMKSKTSNITTSFLKNYLDFNNQNAIILLWNGYIIKNGRFLSLKETHDSICNQNHDITYIHDAVSDRFDTKKILKRNQISFKLLVIPIEVAEL
ncbi:hypothetical protein AGLY_016706 [Aphis glycines]|uniref:Uncharacterized protein n=1 Tax=Aphis glycines TaxID=307491 RepID=A0A6G0SXS5_APHGL|nr:hypothetical protein AGLY_016706 [Aphis glycines]